ncbi:MAG: methyltransferase [Clostridia bacterium]|nr:methyltransferase [Clostridia bacterium]
MGEYVQTTINGGLTIREPKDGLRFGTDALLLAGFACGRLGKGPCADFGTGSGVLPLLLLSAGSRNTFTAVEIQEPYAALAEENVRANGFSSSVRVLPGDLRDHRALLPAGAFSSVLCNPPYFPFGSGYPNRCPEKQISRHAETLTVAQMAEAAGWALRSGGKLFCVYLPSGLVSLLTALRANALEPKRLRLVSPTLAEKPSLVLVEAKKDAAEGLVTEAPFPLYLDGSHRTPSSEMEEIRSLFLDGRAENKTVH